MDSPRSNSKRALILGYPVDLVNMEDAVNMVEDHIGQKTGMHVVTVNPEMIMAGNRNLELGEAIKEADLIIPDGIGVVKVLRNMGIKHIKRLPGIELSEKLVEISSQKGYKVALIGAAPDVISTAEANLKKKYPGLNVVFTHDGFFNSEEEVKMVEDLELASPDIVFVALGVPKQELWISRYKNILDSAIMVGVGGSFDVWADRVKRAPAQFRKLGLEWFYRLITQPSRFNRMFPTLPLFFLKVAMDKKETRKEY